MSTFLRDKSTLNFDAAKLLKESPNYHHCSSIHCSYFSCFQVIKYIVIEIYGVNEESIYMAKRPDPTRPKSEHEYLIEYLHRKLIEKKQLIDASAFKNKINELKSLRTVSDYKTEPIDKTKSDKAYNLADEISMILKKAYKYESN